MKKIMFNSKYGLTQAVLDGYKTMTRRIITLSDTDKEYLDTAFDWDLRESVILDRYARYEIGEVVAVAQAFGEIYEEYRKNGLGIEACNMAVKYQGHPGWNNKMFVCADLMPHRICITDIKVERLQDISDEDCLKEGIMEGEFMNTWDKYYYDTWGDVPNHVTFKTPREAFASLIDKVSGRGIWDSNPYVIAYSFEHKISPTIETQKLSRCY